MTIDASFNVKVNRTMPRVKSVSTSPNMGPTPFNFISSQQIRPLDMLKLHRHVSTDNMHYMMDKKTKKTKYNKTAL